MSQSMFGGSTSYENQSIQDITEDIKKWIGLTEEIKIIIIKNKSIVEKTDFWDRVGTNFKITISETIKYLDEFLPDFNLLNRSLQKGKITKKEVNTLKSIGEKSIEFNKKYLITFKRDGAEWRDYENENFRYIEEIYNKGKDYFVTLEDASNAADSLLDFIWKSNYY